MRSYHDNFSTVEKRTSQSSDNASKSSSPLRTKAVEPVLIFLAPEQFDPKNQKKHCIICIARLPHKLALWIRNPNFRLRLRKLLALALAIHNSFSSGSTDMLRTILTLAWVFGQLIVRLKFLDMGTVHWIGLQTQCSIQIHCFIKHSVRCEVCYKKYLMAYGSSGCNGWARVKREQTKSRECPLRTILFYLGHLQHKRERPDMERKYMNSDKAQRKEPEFNNLVKLDCGWWHKYTKQASLRSPILNLIEDSG